MFDAHASAYSADFPKRCQVVASMLACCSVFYDESVGDEEEEEGEIVDGEDPKPQLEDDSAMLVSIWPSSNYKEIVRLLLEHNADPDLQNQDGALRLASLYGHNSVVRMLLDHPNTDPNLQTYTGWASDDFPYDIEPFDEWPPSTTQDLMSDEEMMKGLYDE